MKSDKFTIASQRKFTLHSIKLLQVYFKLHFSSKLRAFRNLTETVLNVVCKH